MWKGTDKEKLTFDDLVSLINDDDSHLYKRIGRRAATLRGTRPYWKVGRDELEAMVLDTDIPSVCFTISIADLEWADLYEHLSDLDLSYVDPLFSSMSPAALLVATGDGTVEH